MILQIDDLGFAMANAPYAPFGGNLHYICIGKELKIECNDKQLLDLQAELNEYIKTENVR